MPHSSPRQEAKRLVFVLVFAVVIIAGFKTVLPSFSSWAGNLFVQHQVIPAVENSHRSSAAMRAQQDFVPAARKQFPVLTHKVSEAELVNMAADVCLFLDDTDTKTQPDEAASRVTETMRAASKKQVRQVVQLSVRTSCPLEGKGHKQ